MPSRTIEVNFAPHHPGVARQVAGVPQGAGDAALEPAGELFDVLVLEWLCRMEERAREGARAGEDAVGHQGVEVEWS